MDSRDDDAPELVENTGHQLANAPSSGADTLESGLEELSISKVPLTIVTGRLVKEPLFDRQKLTRGGKAIWVLEKLHWSTIFYENSMGRR